MVVAAAAGPVHTWSVEARIGWQTGMESDEL